MKLVEAIVYLARRRRAQLQAGAPVPDDRPMHAPLPAINVPPSSARALQPALPPAPAAEDGAILPTRGRISSRYGMRMHPILKVEKLHRGVDIAAPSGTPVWATSAGVVAFAGVQRGFGKTVILNHPGGLQTLYAHLSAISVQVRQAVVAGQVIGAVGQTGLATGPHLHYEKRRDGKPVSPGIG